MFYKKDLYKLKQFIFNNWMSDVQAFQHRYIYLEDDMELVSLHGTPMELQPFADATGVNITIWASQNTNYPNLYIMRLLRNLIRFRPVVYFEEESSDHVLQKTFLGGYDMNLIPLTSVMSSDSLAPSITLTDHIFITDLAMRSSPTYFMDQFVPTLWMAFLISFLLCGLVLNFGCMCLKKLSSGPFNSFSWVSIMARQGGDETLLFNSRNIALITLGILTNIFHDSFEAFLSSSLSIRVFDLPFSDLNGLLNAKDYTVCTIPHTAAYDYITAIKNININVKHNSEDCPQYFREFNPILKSSTTNLTRCPDGKFAYMGLGSFWNQDWNGKCNILPLTDKYFTMYITINVAPGFKYREDFNMGILRLRSGGHLHKLVAFYDELGYFLIGSKNGRYKYIDQRQNVSQSIDISQIIIILMILFSGIFVSIFIGIVEMVLKRLF